jgi:hypothetical protein
MPSDFSMALKRFMRNRNRLLTYVGAFIVFGTFVVKDGLREHLRDAAGSISAASNVFAIREDNIETRLELADLKKNLADKDAANRSWSDVRVVQTKSQQMYYSLGAVAYLIETTHDEEDVPRITVLDQELTKIRFGSLDLNMSPSTVSALSLSASALELQLAQFEDEVMQHARLKLQRKQELYDIFTWVSYVLYAIGWGLGLVGKLYGVDGFSTT